MNLYELFRKLIMATARSGMLSQEDARNGIDLIARLESVNALGTQVSIKTGIHAFTSDGKSPYSRPVCKVCGKTEGNHE